MAYLIYKLDKKRGIESQFIDLHTEIWKPSITNFYHERLPRKYILWWFFHYFGIFRNKVFQIRLFYDNKFLAHFFCIVPKYYRWPFMKKHDVQITYVITEKKYQGKGLAYQCISYVLSNLEVNGVIWYVTDSENIPSQRLAEKLGFEFQGIGIRKSYFFGLIKILTLRK